MSCWWTRKAKKQVGFMPTTRVRNQYECDTETTFNDYAVNAKENGLGPTYTRPQSKSKMRQNLKKGLRQNLGPAVSSVGNVVLPTKAEELSRTAAMLSKRKTYGTGWVNAEVVGEEAIAERQTLRNKARHNHNAKLATLRMDFFKNESASELEKMPFEKRVEFGEKKHNLNRQLQLQLWNANTAYYDMMRDTPKGTPIVAAPKRTLNQRLKNAQQVRNAASSWWNRRTQPALKAAKKVTPGDREPRVLTR